MADTEADDTYSGALRREIMRSEQQRMRVLVIILAAVLAAAMFVLNLIPEIDERLFDNKVPGWVPLAGIGPYLLYELVALSLLRRRSAKGKDFPRIARFGNALIETSLPASITYMLSGYMSPQLVFAFWPPLLFFVFILLSTLRLDFWLSVWTGAVAAVLMVRHRIDPALAVVACASAGAALAPTRSEDRTAKASLFMMAFPERSRCFRPCFAAT